MEVARIESENNVSRCREVGRLPRERRQSEIKHESRRDYNSGNRTELREAMIRRLCVIAHYRSLAIIRLFFCHATAKYVLHLLDDYGLLEGKKYNLWRHIIY